MKKARETADWKAFMERGAFNQTFMSGAELSAWLVKEDKRHEDLMREAGFIAAK